MKKCFILLVLGTIASQSCFASVCDLTIQELRAKKAALAIEAISTNGAKPLTVDAYSLSSEVETWGIVLSYSGVQKTYRVTVDSNTCEVTKVIKAS